MNPSLSFRRPGLKSIVASRFLLGEEMLRRMRWPRGTQGFWWSDLFEFSAAFHVRVWRCASRRRLQGLLLCLSSLQTRLFKFKSMVINNANK